MILCPVLMALGGVQIVRRVAEYAVAKPTREMLLRSPFQIGPPGVSFSGSR